MRVGIVDDDLWIRRGREAVLVGAGHTVPVSTDQQGALDGPEQFDDLDLVLVDARDDNAEFDQYRGVAVVQTIRGRRSADELTVVVVTGHALDDVLRLRMADAGADALYSHSDISTPDELLALVSDPSALPGQPPPDPEALRRAGLGPDARPNEAIAFIEQEGLETAFGAASTGESQKALSQPRRRLMNTRLRLADMLDTSPTDQRAKVTEWRALVRVVDRLRGDERR